MTDPEREREPKSLDDWLRPYFTDSTLVPVALVAAGCFAALGGGIMAWAVRGRSLAAIAALVLLAGMSVDKLVRDWRRHGRPSLAGRAVLALWALSAVAAAAALALGLA